MTKNPYDVLGVPSTASDDEIKKAYRDLTRKYHPDANVNNPLADLAEEKFKEVQEAYDLIMKDRANGGYQYGGKTGGYNYGGYGQNQGGYNYGGYGQGQGGYQYGGGYNYGGGQQRSTEVQAVYNFLSNRRYQDALNVLGRMTNRNAEWYYLSALANNGMGNNILAKEQAAQAVNMEPNNLQYRQLLNQLNWNTQRYQGNPYGGYSNQQSCGTGNACCDLWMLDTLCECMGGDLCSCL